MSHRFDKRREIAIRVLLSVAEIFAIAVLLGVSVLRAMQAHAPLLHPTAASPSFEVATIKPSQEQNSGLKIRMDPANFTMEHASLKDLIKYAYSVRSDDQIQGKPGWMTNQFFDIHGRAAESEIETIKTLNFPQDVEQTQLMVQSLLADRFRLKVSFRTRDIPVYALVVAKEGPKLKAVTITPLPPPGEDPPPGAHLPSISKTGPNQFTAAAWPMNMMADWLSRFDEVGTRLVLDETGLKGDYDFVLNGVSVAPSVDSTTTSIFTALKEQLGLKLVPVKAPVETLFIDYVEHPSAN